MKIQVLENNKKSKAIAQKYNINIDCANVLINRNVNENIIEVLTNNNFYELLPNDSIKNIPKAVEVISSFLENDNAVIYIFGDFDNDGIQSTYIMYDCLNMLVKILNSKCKIKYHIPERKEGYGLNIDWCHDIVNKKKDKDVLVITVDNGITKKYEVDYLLFNEIQVIVTDHHYPQKDLIPNCIIVDELLDNKNEYMGLCGAGVVFKLCSYMLCDYYGDTSNYNLFYLPNVATATISDMMPVTLENSIFVRNGLIMLNNKECECSDALEYYMSYRGYKQLMPKDIAFEFGPQINACGRMGEANKAFDFMLGENIYNSIVVLNDQRKELTKEIFEQILDNYISNDTLAVAVINNDDKISGCAGLLANKLLEETGRPSIIFTDRGKVLTGSARSIPGIGLQKILSILKRNGYVSFFGGHDYACGITIEKKNLLEFCNAFNEFILSTIEIVDEEDLEEEVIEVDKVLNVKDINLKTINKYKDILFYNDLKYPKFYAENVFINKAEIKSNPENIYFTFEDETGKASAWCWKFKKKYDSLGEPKKVNMVFELEKFNNFTVINILHMEKAV